MKTMKILWPISVGYLIYHRYIVYHIPKLPDRPSTHKWCQLY